MTLISSTSILDATFDEQRCLSLVVATGPPFCLITDIAYRMALLNPSLGEDILEEPGIMLIDEVEPHLHPLWQARILGNLRSIFPNIQFAVTTHAPAVISSVRPQQVRIIADGEKAMARTTEIYGSNADRVLTSIMNAPERPVKIQAKLDAIYTLLDSGNYNATQKAIDDLASTLETMTPTLLERAQPYRPRRWPIFVLPINVAQA